MKLHGYQSLTKALPVFRRIFPQALLAEMEKDFLPRGKYARRARPHELVQSMMKAIVLRLSCQAEIVRECPALKLSGPSSLSYDLDRPWLADYTAEMNSYLRQRHPTYDAAVCLHPRLVIDTMPCLIPITQRGTCAKYNNVAKGCGVMSTFNIDACEGQSPVEILKIMPGGWNDSYKVRDIGLVAAGPIYIADRGFYSLQTMQMWRTQNVHFIVRAKKHNLSYSVVESLPAPTTKAAKVTIESDQVVMLGKANCAFRSKVRMLKAWLDSGEDLWLVTDQFHFTADQLLDSYLKRGTIEVYHRFIKQSVGLAHLYSFDQHGIETQVHLIVLLANLLYLSAPEDVFKSMCILDVIAEIMNQLRRDLKIPKLWQRNTVAQRRRKPEHNRRHLKQRSTGLQKELNL